MADIPPSADEAFWVIWNGEFGVVDTVTIGRIETVGGARQAWLEEPYDMVGPFCLDQLDKSGQIGFEACLVMSRQRWQADQVALRQASLQQRRDAQRRMFEEFARLSEREASQPTAFEQHSERKHRASLDLPMEGGLEIAQIKTAYRKLAQKLHPDAGGSHEAFVRITEARDALLACVS